MFLLSVKGRVVNVSPLKFERPLSIRILSILVDSDRFNIISTRVVCEWFPLNSVNDFQNTWILLDTYGTNNDKQDDENTWSTSV